MASATAPPTPWSISSKIIRGCGPAVARGERRLQRQREAGQFAAGGYGPERRERRARQGRDLELDAVTARRSGAVRAQRLDRDAEARLFELERDEFGLHRRGQRPSGLDAGGGQGRGGAIVRPLGGGGGGAGVVQRLLRGAHRQQARREIGTRRRQGVHLDVQLAGHGAQGEQPLLGPLELVRLEREGGGGGVHRGGLGGFDQSAVGGFESGDDERHRPSRRLDPRAQHPVASAFKRADSLPQPVLERIAADRIAGRVDVGQGLFRRAQHAASLGEARGLSGARRQPVQFGEGVGQNLALLAGGGLCGFKRFDRAPRFAPSAPGDRAGFGERPAAAEGVELPAVGAWVEQATVSC